ncbi:MAG: SMP-30/gluconolactonase/LRE family protein [Lunatimonas sp.]|uniref:SMP-30/gluconolactonase/LRE family protein n=1 Tax=Lunatimonas sp. TaxID=2060141 RepID=UPI00263B5EC6|nr:SMP-30/gluconolactonase/LRE family protein [Lunatimonas sp.]MCC5935911.1 SMP-30/gluconolactonase/LRE family protein [Lunatimonas sp.]
MMNPKNFLLLLSVIIFSFSMGLIDAPAQSVVKLNPAMDRIVDEHVQVEKLAGGFAFTEGPVWSATEGYLLFSDIPANTVNKWTPDGKVTPYRQPSNNANGLTYDRSGNLLLAEHSGRKVGILSPDGSYASLVDSYQGTRFNSPNDVIVDRKGAVYFTDPPYGLDKAASDTLGFNGIYRYEKGKLTLLANDLYRPNGLALSPDERVLYVANSDRPKKYMKYAIAKNGKVGKGQLFFDASTLEGAGSPDGIKVDVEGNVYATGPGGVLVISPQGKHLGTIRFPEVPANLAFGGADRKTLYVTARTGLYAVQVKIPGNN